jgi:hypothetical protein
MKLNQLSGFRHRAGLFTGLLIMVSIGLTGAWMAWSIINDGSQRRYSSELPVPTGSFLMKYAARQPKPL